MALPVRHTAASTAEGPILLGLSAVAFLIFCVLVTSRYFADDIKSSEVSAAISVILPTDEEEDITQAKIDIPTCELPAPPSLYEPEELTFPSDFYLSTTEDEILTDEEYTEPTFAILSPAELPPETESEPRKTNKDKPKGIKQTYTPPRYAATPQPPYPQELLRQKRNGSVRVRIQVNTRGNATGVEVLSSTHPAFAKSAKQTIMRSWRFAPAREGNTPVAAAVTTTINFKL
jgi:TonB family protein